MSSITVIIRCASAFEADFLDAIHCLRARSLKFQLNNIELGNSIEAQFNVFCHSFRWCRWHAANRTDYRTNNDIFVFNVLNDIHTLFVYMCKCKCVERQQFRLTLCFHQFAQNIASWQRERSSPGKKKTVFPQRAQNVKTSFSPEIINMSLLKYIVELIQLTKRSEFENTK